MIEHTDIMTINCGQITVPINHITLQAVNGTFRAMVRDCGEWWEISEESYSYLCGEIYTMGRTP